MGENIKLWQGIVALGGVFACAVLAWGRTQWDISDLKAWRDERKKKDRKMEFLLVKIAEKMGIQTNLEDE